MHYYYQYAFLICFFKNKVVKIDVELNLLTNDNLCIVVCFFKIKFFKIDAELN